MVTEWQRLDRIWDLPDRNNIKSDTLRRVLREFHSSTGAAGYEYIPGPVERTEPLVVDEGRTVVIGGNLSIGTAGSPLTVDQTHLTIKEGGRLVVLGTLDVHRNVAATVPLVEIDGGEVMADGNTTLVHAGGGGVFTFYVTGASTLQFGADYSLTTDVTGVLAAGIWAEGGLNRMSVYGDMAVTCTGDRGYPVALYESSLVVGQYSAGTGTLSVTWTGTTSNNFGVLYVGANSSVWVRGNGTTTITANSQTSQPGLGVFQNARVEIGGMLNISMTSQTGAPLITVKTQADCEINNIGTFAAGAMTVGALDASEEGTLSIQGTCNLSGTAASAKVHKSGHMYVENVEFGSSGTELTRDVIGLEVIEGSTFAGGNVEVYRNVSASTHLVSFKAAEVSIRGTFDATHAGGGNNVAWLLEDSADVVVDGLATLTTDATGAAAVALKGNAKADATFKAGLTIVATGTDVRPIYVVGDVSVVVGDTVNASGNLTVTRSGSGNVWTQNAFSLGSKLTVGGDIIITANSITANEVPLFLDASDLVCSGDVTITATSLADGGLQLYNGATFKNSHNLKTFSITLGSTAVEAIKVMRQSSFTMANDVILEGTAAAVMIDDGSEMNVSGDLLLGNTTEQPGDMTCLSVLDGGELTVGGALTVKRDVAAATALMHVRAAKVNVGGVFTHVHSGGGTGYGIWMASSGEINVEGAASITSDITSGSWAVVLYASSGGSALRWRGGLTVSCTGANVRPVAVTDCEFLVGNPETLTGALAITHTGTAVQGWAVATFTKGTFSCVGDCTVTANSIVTGGGGLVVRQGHLQVGGELSVSMTSKTDGKLVWALHKCHMTSYDIGTLTPSGSATAASILVEENGHFEVQRNADFTGNGGTLKVVQQSSVYFNSPSFGTSGDPVTIDVPCIEIDDFSEFYTESHVACYRDVSAATPIFKVSEGTKVQVAGNLTLDHSGGGAAESLAIYPNGFLYVEGAVIQVTDTTFHAIHVEGGELKVDGNYTLTAGSSPQAVHILLNGRFVHTGIFNLVSVGTSTGDGGFLVLQGEGKAYMDCIKFNSGSGLDLGAFASIYVFENSHLNVTDTTDTSDALNENAGAAAQGIRLRDASTAFIPTWATNNGVGVTGGSSGDDYQMGSAAAADHPGGAQRVPAVGYVNNLELCYMKWA